MPRKSHGWRSLVGYSPWGRYESLSLFTFTQWRRQWQPTPVFLPGESRDGGAWWAAVYGIAQSRTLLKRLLKKKKKGLPWCKLSELLLILCTCLPVLLPKRLSAAAAAKSLQLCPTLCNPIDGSPPGSPVPGILQARTLEWVAISFSNA